RRGAHDAAPLVLLKPKNEHPAARANPASGWQNQRTMKSTTSAVISFLVLLTTAASGTGAEPWEADYGRLLAKYVTPAGTVKYKDWKANADDVAALQKVTDQIGSGAPAE